MPFFFIFIVHNFFFFFAFLVITMLDLPSFFVSFVAQLGSSCDEIVEKGKTWFAFENNKLTGSCLFCCIVNVNGDVLDFNPRI